MNPPSYPRPEIVPDLTAPTVVDPARYFRFAFEGGDVGAVITEEIGKLSRGSLNPVALMNLSVLYQLIGRREDALKCQQAALHVGRLYRNERADDAPPPVLRLLALMTEGDLMANAPIELLLEGSDVEVTRLFLAADFPNALPLPEHDLAIIALGESDETRPLLQRLEAIAPHWPRPLLNDAAGIASLARDRLYETLGGIASLAIPVTMRTPRALLEHIGAGNGCPTASAEDVFPMILRPVGSHAGKGLEKLDAPADLAAYLQDQAAPVLYVSAFIDYSSPDGRFRKYRIAFFGGRAWLCHMAIGEHWMVHYLNAGMAEDPAKRAEEQAAMETFDQDFAVRHGEAFAVLQARTGLDYFAIDCAELPDGRLLVFEADVAMIVHDLDPPDLYPYKKPQMRRLFDAFEQFLRAKAAAVNPS